MWRSDVPRARAAEEGLLEPLDYSLIPNAKDIDPRLRAEHTVGEWTFSTVIGVEHQNCQDAANHLGRVLGREEVSG